MLHVAVFRPCGKSREIDALTKKKVKEFEHNADLTAVDCSARRARGLPKTDYCRSPSSLNPYYFVARLNRAKIENT